MPRFFKFALYALLLSASFGAFAMGDTPFDPLIGPRNPKPAAAAYLATRNDLPEEAKQNFLSDRPSTAEFLVGLADVSVIEVRAMVGGNQNTPVSVLTKLAQDPEASVRQYVASNHAAPHALLEQLSHDDDQNVIWSLDHNPSWHLATEAK